MRLIPLERGAIRRIVPRVIVYAIIDVRSSPDHPLGDAVDTFVRREDAEHFIEEVRGDDPDLASYLRIEKRELGPEARAIRFLSESAFRNRLDSYGKLAEVIDSGRT